MRNLTMDERVANLAAQYHKAVRTRRRNIRARVAAGEEIPLAELWQSRRNTDILFVRWERMEAVLQTRRGEIRS